MLFKLFVILLAVLLAAVFGKITGIALSIFFGFAKIGFKIGLIVFILMAILFFL